MTIVALPDSPPTRARSVVLAVLAALPPLVVAVYVARYKLGMPYWDGWVLIPDIQKMFTNQLTWQELWRTHNEHRIVLPRLIMLGLARLTGWDDGYEVALNLGLASATCLALLAQWRSTTARLGWAGANGLVPLISLLVFALTQWENWVWGWQMVYYLHTLAAIGSLLLLTNWDGHWWRWLGAAALGLAATFSLGMGLLIWPIGLLVLLLLWRARAAPQLWSAGLWALVGLLAYVLYFTDYPRLPGPSPLQVVLQQPLDLAHYVFNFLGSPVLTYDYAYVFGFLGLVAWWGAAFWLARRSWPNIQLLLPYVGLGLYSQAGAAMVAVSRLQFGTHQAIASRYVTLSYPFWVSLVVFLYWVGASQPPAPREPGWRFLGRARTWTNLALLGIALQVVFCSMVGAALGYYWRYQAVLPVRAAALAGAPLNDQLLGTICPFPSDARFWLEYLRQQHLSLFHTS
jgi:hypothetical protein